MKKLTLLITALTGLTSFAAFSADTLKVNNSFKNRTSTPANLMVYAEYETLSTNFLCVEHSMADGKYDTFPKVAQRIVVVSNSSAFIELPLQYGFCKYRMTSYAVLVATPTLLSNIVKNEGKKVSDDTYEFKGGISGLVKPTQGADKNLLKCSFSKNPIVAKCDKEFITTSDATAINVDVELE